MLDTKKKEAAEYSKEIDSPLVLDYDKWDVQCGFWVCQGPFFQKFASKKLYVLLFGFAGCMLGSTTSYFYGTLSTVEKSLQISSQNVGIIMAASDLSFVLSSVFLSYYASTGRKPLWIALGLFSMALSCFVNALPHFIFGPNQQDLIQVSTNVTLEASKGTASLCVRNRDHPDCTTEVGNLKPQLLLALGSLFSGMGTSLYFTLGNTYLDDNVEKHKVPFLTSLAAFGRRLGPLVGFSVASLCLKYFLFPGFNPGYDSSDPRWIGAWWVGWLVLGTTLLLLAPLFAGFPKMLPKAAERKALSRHASGANGTEKSIKTEKSLGDWITTFKRLITNKAYVFNNTANIFYTFGYMPYFLFQTKYLEIQYRLTPSEANMVTGSASLVFSALGILIAGAVIQKIRPTSRQLAGWNIVTSVLSALGIALYSVFGCTALNNAAIVSNSQGAECSIGCNCDFVKYAPICGSDGNTYLSPCHAGCKDQFKQANGTILYTDCSCIQNPLNITYSSFDINPFNVTSETTSNLPMSGSAISGSCPVDCMNAFYLFLLVMCLNKFIGGTESAANFLIGLRCVEERDKAISMGLSMAINTLFSFLPSPIIFGMIIDRTCVLWGRTCSKKGNCWLYDGLALRKNMNYTSAVFVIIGTCFDLGTWWYSKNFKIFDDKEKEVPATGGEEDECEEQFVKHGVEQKELVVLVKETKDRE